MLFGSGMAAAVSVFQALRPGDHVIAPKVMYWALRKLVELIFKKLGVSGIDLLTPRTLIAHSSRIQTAKRS